MKKVKYVLTLLLVLSLSFTLSACHKKRALEVFSVPESFDYNKNYEINFWAKNDNNMNQKNIYNQAIEKFEALYPNINVTLKSYTDYSSIYNDVITNISTNTTPNVCITYPDHVATYLEGDNIVVSLDELIDDSKFGLGGSEVKFDSVKKDEIVESFLNECTLSDTYYLLPFMRSTEAMYINKDYVESLGYTVPDIMTWDFVYEVSQKAISKRKENQVLIPFIYKSTDNMMIQMLNQLDAPYSSKDGEIFIFNDETTNVLLDIKEIAETGAFSTFKISSYPGNFLNAGQCIFAVDSTAGATWMGSNAPLMDIDKDSVVQFETVVRPIPQYDTTNPLMISQGPSLCLFNKEDDGEVLASWLFMQYLLTNETQIAYAKTEGYIPVTNKALNDATYLDYLSREGEDNNEHYNVKIQASKLLLNNIENTFVTPAFRGSASLRDASGYLIEEVTKKSKLLEVDKDYIENTVYPNAISLYRIGLDTKASYQKLPLASIMLIVIIVVLWLLILTYLIYNNIVKKRKFSKKEKK
ncbi:MAG: extracellular solute-binding protein [Gammaproteobacteria bacterium]|nr:extracellular solute-binding protein [Gammaproteobacteria bacterium]